MGGYPLGASETDVSFNKEYIRNRSFGERFFEIFNDQQ